MSVSGIPSYHSLTMILPPLEMMKKSDYTKTDPESSGLDLNLDPNITPKRGYSWYRSKAGDVISGRGQAT